MLDNRLINTEPRRVKGIRAQGEPDRDNVASVLRNLHLWAIFLVAFALAGCGARASLFDGEIPDQSEVDAGSDAAPPPACMKDGLVCADPQECCSGVCLNSHCGGVTCMPDAQSCSVDEDCCSHQCTGGTCASVCKSDGAKCNTAKDCCDGQCNGGVCGAAMCAQNGAPCNVGSDCCSEVCNGGICGGGCGLPGVEMR